MTQDGWKLLILNAVRDKENGDDHSFVLLSKLLEEQDTARHLLRQKGYGMTGMGFIDMVNEVNVKE